MIRAATKSENPTNTLKSAIPFNTSDAGLSSITARIAKDCFKTTTRNAKSIPESKRNIVLNNSDAVRMFKI